MRLSTIALVACFALAGCHSRHSEPEPLERTRLALQNGESVLDTRADGATLVVRALEEKPLSDGPRHLAIRLVAGEKSIDLGTLADARLVDGAVVALGTDGALSRIGDDGGRRQIDRDAHAPLSVRGRSVAYVRGEPPTLELVVADIDKGGPAALAPEWVPAWCPVLADDGSIVFVTGHAGHAQIARVRPGEAPRVLLAQPDAFPEGPDTPTLAGNQLTFEFRGAQKTLSLGEVR
jgi:hypothetical protein